jgi:hypothetical protein
MRAFLAFLAFVLTLPAAAQTVVQPPSTGTTATAAAPVYTAGFWYPTSTGTVGAGLAWATGAMRLTPVSITKPITIDQVAIYVSTLASGGNTTVHLWSSTSANRPTGTSAFCTVSTTTTGLKTCTLSSPVSIIAPGVYWLGVESDATAANAIFQSITGQTTNSTYLYGSASLAAVSSGSIGKIYLSWSHAYFGAAADITGATLTEGTGANDAMPYIHVSSIP